MGSGSSKSKRRAIKICSNQLLEPPVAPIGSKKTVTCDQKKEDNNKETPAEGSNTTLTEKDRFTSIDPDLKLIEDILTESEDCFFWPASSFARQMVTSSQNANTSHGSLFQVPQNQSADNKNLQTLNKTMSVCEESQNKYQTARDSCNTTVSKMCNGLPFVCGRSVATGKPVKGSCMQSPPPQRTPLYIITLFKCMQKYFFFSVWIKCGMIRTSIMFFAVCGLGFTLLLVLVTIDEFGFGPNQEVNCYCWANEPWPWDSPPCICIFTTG